MAMRTNQIKEMIDMLPEEEQHLAFEFIKRLVLAWDIDYTKLTPHERERLINSEKEFNDGDLIDHEEIQW